MIVPKFLGYVSSPHVLEVAVKVLGDNKEVVATVAANPNITVGVVEPFYERFKPAAVTRLLLEHSTDPELVTFLLDRKERRVGVLQTALFNWFLPDDLYLSVMGRLSSDNARVFIDAADGYSKKVKTLAALNLEPVDAAKWVVWDDTGFCDEQLLQMCNIVSFYLGGGEDVNRRAIEAVLFRRPHLINRLKMPYYRNLSTLLAGMPISEQVVANIIDSSLAEPGRYGQVWFTLLQNPWLPPSMFETVQAQMALYMVRNGLGDRLEFLQTEPVTWSEVTQNFGELWSFRNVLGGYVSSTLLHRVLLEILLDPDLMADDNFVASLRTVFNSSYLWRVPVVEWFPREAVLALQNVLEVDRSIFAQRFPLHWGYEDRLPLYHERSADTPVLWPQHFDHVVDSDVPIRRTNLEPFSDSDTLPVELNWSGSTPNDLAWKDSDELDAMLPNRAADQADWFETELGDGTTPNSIAEWETLFQLLPTWEQTFGKLVETSKKLVSLQ